MLHLFTNGMGMQSVPANDGAGTGLVLSYPSRRI